MSETALKPCPFCGWKYPVLHSYNDNVNPEFWVTCHECGATISDTGETREDAVRAWNRRA